MKDSEGEGRPDQGRRLIWMNIQRIPSFLFRVLCFSHTKLFSLFILRAIQGTIIGIQRNVTRTIMPQRWCIEMPGMYVF